MQVFRTPTLLKSFLQKKQYKGSKIGFVPTMGALHEGHIALIETAKKDDTLVVCSIYVNPTQFNDTNDFQLYPRDIDNDIKKLEEAGCDVLFLPENEHMYLEEPIIRFHFGKLESTMEGLFRKNHFTGVALIVSKLFHIVNPNFAYFGQKDLQQFIIIRQLIRDLSFDVKLICVPTVRSSNGLAMSSRNKRLSYKALENAADIYEGLTMTKNALLHEKKTVKEAKDILKEFFAKKDCFKVEYIEIVETEHLQPINKIDGYAQVAICIAAEIDSVRLIDNIFLYS